MIQILQNSSRQQAIALAAFGSAALLIAAFGFQYIGGLLPCAMCIWQRWPHVAAIALGALGAAIPTVWVALLGALSMVGNAGISFFHTGVERDWWDGPNSCGQSAAQDLSTLSVTDLLDTSTGPQLVLCDQVAWQFLGLSMASWNGIACLALAVMWLIAARQAAR
ncbi:MAG: disulfide bond formation protein B [Pseudomonadota bacterium]